MAPSVPSRHLPGPSPWDLCMALPVGGGCPARDAAPALAPCKWSHFRGQRLFFSCARSAISAIFSPLWWLLVGGIKGLRIDGNIWVGCYGQHQNRQGHDPCHPITPSASPSGDVARCCSCSGLISSFLTRSPCRALPFHRTLQLVPALPLSVLEA